MIGKKENKKTNSAGFTLVEMLVSMLVFSLIISAGSGLLISAVRAQNRTLAIHRILNQTSYALEYMSRAIRMASKEKNPPTCLTTYGLNYEITYGGNGIKFINDDDECLEFFLDTSKNQLKESRNGIENYLTSPDLYVENFKIGPSDSWDQNDDLQPRVTIFLEVRRAGLEPEKQPKIKIQTTISQRRLDILE